jgi:hypothetical protein
MIRRAVRYGGKSNFWAILELIFLLEKLHMDVSPISHRDISEFASRRAFR